MKHPTSRLLFGYWDKLRCARDRPDRAEIEPGRIAHLLPHAFILAAEPAEAPAFRLAGSRCCALFGRDLAGLPFRALWANPVRAEADELTGIARDGNGVVAGLVEFGGGTPCGRLELVLLPLRNRGAKIGRILGALSALELPAPEARAPMSGLTTTSLRVIRLDPPPEGTPAPRPSTRDRLKPSLVVVEGGRSP